MVLGPISLGVVTRTRPTAKGCGLPWTQIPTITLVFTNGDELWNCGSRRVGLEVLEPVVVMVVVVVIDVVDVVVVVVTDTGKDNIPAFIKSAPRHRYLDTGGGTCTI